MTARSDCLSLPSPEPFDLDHTVAAWDALTPEVMRSRGSLKWVQSPFPAAKGDDAFARPGRAGLDGPIGAWVAEMDLGTAPSVTAVLRRAVEDGTLGYTPGALVRAAREATAAFESEVIGWDVPVEQVSLLPNVLSALGAVIAHHTRPGSPVIVPTPAYMPFLSIPGQHGREVIQVPSYREAGTWRLDLEAIEAAMAGEGLPAGDGAAGSEAHPAGPAGLLILCNPWNPVGRVLEADELDAVAALSARYGVPVFSDEIHAPLVLDPLVTFTPYASRPGADPDLTFTATAASKGWNVPGLHCAQLIASGRARRAWEASPLSAALGHQAAALGVAAAVAAFRDGREWNAAARAYIRANAEVVAGALGGTSANAAGGAGGAGAARLTVPTGSYLGWLDLSEAPCPDGVSPAAWLAAHAGVWMNDGAAFGTGFERFARLNLATGRQIAVEIGRRLASALG